MLNCVAIVPREYDLWLATASVDHTDRIGAFNGLTVKGLTFQCAFCGITRETCLTETEVEYQIGVAVAIHIPLVTAELSAFLVHMRLTRPLERDRRVIHRRRIKIIGGQDGYGATSFGLLQLTEFGSLPGLISISTSS